MSYSITESCYNCGICQTSCPTNAIQLDKQEDYRIETELCNGCEGHHEVPQCVISCPISSPVPLRAKKGRYKADYSIITSPDLFTNSKSAPIASSMIVWEGCNVLAQRQSLPWETDEQGRLCYRRQVKSGRGEIAIWPTQTPDPAPSDWLSSIAELESFDLRAACLHLLYAAYATNLDRPWEQEFVLSDRAIEKYLGLDKRKDLTKAAKLTFIKDLAQQPCKLMAAIEWPQQGKVPSFSLSPSRLWHLLDIEHHFQQDSSGYKHLVGLTFRIQPGAWSQYFLNQECHKNRTAFFQYGVLPGFLLDAVTTIWQQHEGAARLMLWLLFKVKVGNHQRIAVPTLMRVAYGQEKMNHAEIQREVRKRLLRTFEGDLEILHRYGLKPVFDEESYPKEIQPLWVKLNDIPDDPEAAIEFWTEDGSGDRSAFDAPRGKWHSLMQAKILHFDLPEEWEEQLAKFEAKKRRKTCKTVRDKVDWSAQQIQTVRKQQGMSQRDLAVKIGKSQSWIRDLEKGRLSPKESDRLLLEEALSPGVKS